jgi:hypothetical protein
MRLFTWLGRTLLPVVAVVFGAICVPECRGDNREVPGDYYSLTKKGTALVYAAKDGKDNVLGYRRETIKDVFGAKDNWTIVRQAETLDKMRRQAKDSPTVETIVQIVDGEMRLDTRSELKPMFEAFEDKEADCKFSGDTLTFMPSKIRPGDRLKDVSLTVIAHKDGETVKIMSSTTNRICLAEENVTVPAGTFKASKVRCIETVDFVVPGNNVRMKSIREDCYVLGIGSVKTVLKDENGKILNTLELQEILK